MASFTPIHPQRKSSSASDRRYFVWFAFFAAALVFAGFTRTYFFQRWFHTPTLSLFIHVHSAVMTGWVVLLGVQTFLVKWRRMPLHRALGYFGAGYAVLVVVMGCSATFLAARREVRAHADDVPSVLKVLALELTQMAMFAVLVALAVVFRNRGAYHKRFMVLATLCMLPNPMVRLLVLVGVMDIGPMMAVWATGVVAVAAIDAFRLRKLHMAFAIGAPAIVAVLYGAYFVSLTPFWQSFAAGMVR